MTAQSVGKDNAVPAQVGTATKASSPAQQIDDTNTTQCLQSECELNEHAAQTAAAVTHPIPVQHMYQSYALPALAESAVIGHGLPSRCQTLLAILPPAQ